MTVVVVAPHPDDEAIGCGGTIIRHVRAGERVVTVFLTSGEGGLSTLSAEQARRVREAEAQDAATILGTADAVFLRGPDSAVARKTDAVGHALRRVLVAETPETIYLPHPCDGHPDHAAALDVVRAALPPDAAPAIHGFEVWTPLASPHFVADISDVVDVKMAAIRCYTSQLTQFAYDEAALGLSRYRGVLMGGCRHAEAFQSFDGRQA